MKFMSDILKITIGICIGVMVCSCCESFDSKESVTSNKKETKSHWEDANEIIYNPDIGFYSAILVKLTKNGIDKFNSIKSEIEEEASLYNGSYNDNSTFNLIHVKVDISDFSKLGYLRESTSESDIAKRSDSALTDDALNDIAGLLDVFRNNEKNAIIRFCYDPGYSGQMSGDTYVDIEPENIETVLDHIDKLCPVLSQYEDVLTAIECGMLGPWGEMHSTTSAKTSGNITKVMEHFLDNLQLSNIPLLVRQPAFIYDYLKLEHSSSVPSYSVAKNSKEYKLGLYNDGYLGSKSDSGTFLINRKEEINFMKQFTEHTPYGGEMIGFNATTDDIGEMFDVHLSFLNIGWNANVLEDLRTKSKYNYSGENAFEYILKHMGYRFVLTNSKITTSTDGKNLDVELNIKNNGFGNLPMHRSKTVKIIITDENGTVAKTVSLDKKFESTSDKEIIIENGSNHIDISDLESSVTYKLYVKLCDDHDKYPIRFANPSSNWNATLKANYAGSFTK